jgi:hypothetical protein
MLGKLCWALTNRVEAQQIAGKLSSRLVQFDWPAVAHQYDDLFQSIVRDSVGASME